MYTLSMEGEGGRSPGEGATVRGEWSALLETLFINFIQGRCCNDETT